MPKGRPTKLTDEVGGLICEKLRIGATLKIAAQSQGINESTLTRWKQRGGSGEEPFASFCTSVARARADYELDTLERLHKLDESTTLDPKIAGPLVKSLTWLLERTRRERYGTQITVKVAEAKEHLLDTVERVCERLGETAVLVAILEELERDGQQEAGEAASEGQPIVH